jgi:uncharacterized protein
LVDLGIFSAGRREKGIFDGILRLLRIVSESVDFFEQSVVAYGNGDPSAEPLAKHVLDSETEADEVHRELSLQVAEGAFFGGVREDILNLMERIDDIADSAKDAARFLTADSRLGVEARGILRSDNMTAFLADLKSAVSSLKRLIEALIVGRKEALAIIHTVEEYEEAADTHKDALLRELFALSDSMNPVTVIQLRDFAFVADDIADNAEDASDVILVLLAKGYG